MEQTISATVLTERETRHPISQSGTISFPAFTNSSRTVISARSKCAEFAFTGGYRGICESERRATQRIQGRALQGPSWQNALVKYPAILVGRFLSFMGGNGLSDR
jgi:hypothetical protein